MIYIIMLLLVAVVSLGVAWHRANARYEEYRRAMSPRVMVSPPENDPMLLRRQAE